MLDRKILVDAGEIAKKQGHSRDSLENELKSRKLPGYPGIIQEFSGEELFVIINAFYNFDSTDTKKKDLMIF